MKPLIPPELLIRVQHTLAARSELSLRLTDETRRATIDQWGLVSGVKREGCGLPYPAPYWSNTQHNHRVPMTGS
jgi:hypothetical protein